MQFLNHYLFCFHDKTTKNKTFERSKAPEINYFFYSGNHMIPEALFLDSLLHCFFVLGKKKQQNKKVSSWHQTMTDKLIKRQTCFR